MFLSYHLRSVGRVRAVVLSVLGAQRFYEVRGLMRIRYAAGGYVKRLRACLTFGCGGRPFRRMVRQCCGSAICLVGCVLINVKNVGRCKCRLVFPTTGLVFVKRCHRFLRVIRSHLWVGSEKCELRLLIQCSASIP